MVSGAALVTTFNALYEVVQQKSQLKSLIKDVETRLKELEPMIKEITPNAMLWGLANIKTEMEDGKKLIEHYKPRSWLFKKTGFSDKLRSLDKSLSDLLPVLSLCLRNYQKQLEQSCEKRLQLLCEQKILTKITCLTCDLPKPPSFTIGLEKPLGKLRKFIVEPEQSMLVITAPAGCGKTTLATVFCHDQKVKENFKQNIFFVDVSKKPNLDHIVEQIFLHKGYTYRLPYAIENERCTESFLVDFLREHQQPVLLVLDGVWCGGEYDELLEKFNQLKLSTLKILVTSRFHFPRFNFLYKSYDSYDLKWLEDESATELFHYPPTDTSPRIPEHISKEVRSFVSCNALIGEVRQVGKLMCKDEYTHGYYSEHFVTQHEMLRELAIHQTRLEPIEERERLIINLCGKDNFRKQMSQPMKARLLAISTERVFSTNWQLPDLEVLVLNLQTDKFELPEFMEKLVDKLKVLIVTYYGLLPATAELSNFQLLSSLSNLKRIRLERISVPCIVKNLIKLERVQKISVFMCDISQAFSDSSIKIFEAFPRLEEMNIDYCNGIEQVPTNLCYHTLLKRLSITNCPELLALPEEIGKLENLEELRLVYCTNLLGLPVSITNLTSLKLLDISDCWSMTVLPSGLCNFKELITRRSYKLHFASDT
ncbi:hypothetical protein M0R45_020141 [Rubus argutus]|uniref:NB-ARC domain-containing protein n=1 Tax=Rubus argutus TaxID=59490 RepID=A0AAW1X8F6_RUBAR